MPETTLGLSPGSCACTRTHALHLLDSQSARLYHRLATRPTICATFGIQYPEIEDERLRRAISWKYQYDLVKSTPKPERWIEVRFEDFVLKQDETLERLEDFLRHSAGPRRHAARTQSIAGNGDDGVNYFDFFEPAMREYNYEIPSDPIGPAPV